MRFNQVARHQLTQQRKLAPVDTTQLRLPIDERRKQLVVTELPQVPFVHAFNSIEQMFHKQSIRVKRICLKLDCPPCQYSPGEITQELSGYPQIKTALRL
jgi:hypothetical protein